MISSFGAILAWKLDDDADAATDDDYDDDRKSDPYMSSSYAGDTKMTDGCALQFINIKLDVGHKTHTIYMREGVVFEQ